MSRLAIKTALGVAAAGAALAASLHLAWMPLPAGVGAALIGVPALAAYGLVSRLLVRRLEQARQTLKQIRRHEFEHLETGPRPPGDEMQALIQEVYRTGQALEKEIRELRKMESYRREFLGNVSHELKTPIFAIQGFAETLLQGALEDGRVNRSFVQKILHNAGRLGHLARDLSEISRLETGELKMKAESFDLRQLVDEVVESLELAAKGKDVHLQARVPAPLPRLLGDRERIRQVLINLIDNAIKYNNPGGRVEVVARMLPGGEVKVSVVDDGIGIAPPDIPRLTERFYRVDRSRSREQGGTGLGLAIVKHILAAHGRRILIESQPGQGATFGFTLPTVP